METKSLNEIHSIISGGNLSKNTALFPHREGTKAVIMDYIKSFPKSTEIRRTKTGYIIEEKLVENPIYFFNFDRLIPFGKELFYKLIDPIIEVAKGYPLVLVFDDWEGNRHEEMLPDIENALNWLKEYPEAFEMINCDTHYFINGVPVD